MLISVCHTITYIIIIIIIIIIIYLFDCNFVFQLIITIFINCQWIDTRWQWSFNILLKHGQIQKATQCLY
jgi:hypothetical protein